MSDQERKTKAPTGCDDERRRLLRASAAAPLIATLAPNAALAMQSATCDQKQLGQTYSPEADSELGGGLVRVSARKHEAVGSDTQPSVIYQTSDGFMDGAGNSMDDKVTVENGVVKVTVENGVVASYKDAGETYLVAYYEVNEHGASYRGHFPQSMSQTQPLSGSCLASIDPQEPNPWTP